MRVGRRQRTRNGDNCRDCVAECRDRGARLWPREHRRRPTLPTGQQSGEPGKRTGEPRVVTVHLAMAGPPVRTSHFSHSDGGWRLSARLACATSHLATYCASLAARSEYSSARARPSAMVTPPKPQPALSHCLHVHRMVPTWLRAAAACATAHSPQRSVHCRGPIGGGCIRACRTVSSTSVPLHTGAAATPLAEAPLPAKPRPRCRRTAMVQSSCGAAGASPSVAVAAAREPAALECASQYSTSAVPSRYRSCAHDTRSAPLRAPRPPRAAMPREQQPTAASGRAVRGARWRMGARAAAGCRAAHTPFVHSVPKHASPRSVHQSGT